MNVADFAAHALEIAPKVWAEISDHGRKEFPPHITLLLPADGGVEVYLVPHGSREEEIQVVEVVRRESHRKHARAASLLCEVWGHPRPSREGDQVRDREDRHEALQLMIQTCMRNDTVYLWPIERDERGARLGSSAKAERYYPGLYRDLVPPLWGGAKP